MNEEKKINLVILDDDQEVHKLISDYFRNLNYNTIHFTNALRAIDQAESEGASWDVFLTDFHFTRLVASDFTQKMKKALPHLPVLLITHDSLTLSTEKEITDGAFDLIFKPIRLPELHQSINRAIELKKLKNDVVKLQNEVKYKSKKSYTIIGKNPVFLDVVDLARRAAPSTASIFIHGESGTGKEVFAKFIHSESHCEKGPFVAINCSAIPENLLESELFGHAKGSFTGAIDKKVGLFEEAQGGTLFLDEIGDLSLPLQAKLLRVLQEKKIKRVGENIQRDINCRIISATHKNLSDEVNSNRFREDLFFRLNVIPIFIPPLRERPEDIIPLANNFLAKFALSNNSQAKTLSPEALKYILSNQWRGNVRELENQIERAVVLSDGEVIKLESFLPDLFLLKNELNKDVHHMSECDFNIKIENFLPRLDEVLRKYVEFSVHFNHGARDKTAKEIGIDRKTLYKWLSDLKKGS